MSLELVIRPSGAGGGRSVASGNTSAISPATETMWIKWVPIYNSVFNISVNNGGDTAYTPNVALYFRHDPANLLLVGRKSGTNGSCDMSITNTRIVAGQHFTICIDNLLVGKGEWSYNQANAMPTPNPTFAVTSRLLTILPGAGSVAGTEITYRIKADENNKAFNWARYRGQLKLETGSYTIEAKAFSPGYLPSQISEQAISLS